MAEYIDRQELFKNLNKFASEHYNAVVNKLIIEQPTVDVVEVVRCKDCKHRGMMKCPMFSFEYRERVDDYETIDSTEDDGFCHWGERNENNAEN